MGLDKSEKVKCGVQAGNNTKDAAKQQITSVSDICADVQYERAA